MAPPDILVICTRAFRNRIIMSRYRNDFFWKISSQNAYCHIGGIAGNLALLNVQAALGCLFLHDFHCIQIMDRCAWKITCLAAVLGWESGLPPDPAACRIWLQSQVHLLLLFYLSYLHE